MFGRLFGDNDSKDILIDFLQSILTDITIKDIESNKQVYLEKDHITKKFGRMDIVATLNNNVKVNIEMQMKDYKNTIPRSVYYQSKLNTSDLEKNHNYSELPRSISIWILNYNLFKEGPYHEISKLKRDYNNLILTDLLEIHYIQLPKFKNECKTISNKLEQWLTFVINEDLKEIENMNNKNIKKAENKLNELNNDARARAYAEYVADAARNEYSVRKYERDEGIKQGISQGISQGIKQNQVAIIKNMLLKNIDIHTIAEITEVPEEEILEIKSTM